MRAALRSIVVATVALIFVACGESSETASNGNKLVVYSGRSKSLVEPILQLFEKSMGVEVNVKYGNTSQLALALKEEGARSKADVFWAQDAGALGAVMKAGLLTKIPQDVLESIPPMFRHKEGMWVATSGRARVFAYSSDRVEEDELPATIHDLTMDRYRDRVGWAPANASFQSFVTALRVVEGEVAAEKWLREMAANGAKAYPKNTAIIQAIVAGEVDFGLPNHYYLLRFKKSDSKFPVEQAFFEAGDVGNLVNVAGIGILETSRNKTAAERFVRFLLSPTAQQYFSSEVFEYPVIDDVIPNANLVGRDELNQAAPKAELSDLDDLDGTLALLRKVGLL